MAICKNCKAELKKTAKFCTNCGTKVKAPIYKKWWFWSLVVIVVVCGIVYAQISFNQRMDSVAAYIEAGDFENAKSMLEDELITNPQAHEVYILYADYYIKKGEYNNAVQILQQGEKKVSTDNQKEKIAEKLNFITSEYANEIAEEVARLKQEAEEREKKLREEEEAKRKQQAEEEQAAEQAYKDSCVQIKYEDLARQPEEHKGKKVTFTGKVVQVMESGKNVTLRVNVTKGEYDIWTDNVYVDYKYSEGESRILENDIITLYGEFKGIKSYTAVLGNKVSIPHVAAKYIAIKH